MSINEVLEAVRGMLPSERARVKALLDTLPSECDPAQDEAQRRLADAGLITQVPSLPASDIERHTPVQIKGKPLSETVIGERR